MPRFTLGRHGAGGRQLEAYEANGENLSGFEKVLLKTFRRRSFLRMALITPAAYALLRLLPGKWESIASAATQCYWVVTGDYCYAYCGTSCCSPFPDYTAFYWCTYIEEECCDDEFDCWRTGNKFCGCHYMGCDCYGVGC